jgi:phosphoserine phosphatase RsbU/P
MARGPSPEALALLDMAACGLLRTTDDGTVLFANRTFCDWVGYPAEALVDRRRFQDFLSAGGRIFHQTHWSPLLRMQGSISEVKLQVVTADGSLTPMIVNARRHQIDGAFVHEIATYVARDRDSYERELVLARKRLEDLVDEAAKLHVETKDRALFAEQMIGIVSHDLKNPISAIAMGAALLERTELSISQQRVVSRITRSTARASGLIADLLDFTQARLGRGIPVCLEPIDLHDSVSLAVDELNVVYPARRLKHERRGTGTCLGDAQRLAQLIGNLVSNAMAYGAAEREVTVRSTVEAAVFSVAVHNHGEPIPVALQSHLFEPMTRGTSTSAAGRSVGLGLYIVSEIAKAHRGRMLVTSSAEEGTTIQALFPRSAPAPNC